MKSYRIILTLLLVFLLFSQSAGAKTELTWLTTHWPPIMIWDSPSVKVTGGSWGKKLNLIKKQMPDYEHRYQEMRWNRFWKAVEKGQNICNCMAIKTKEREEIAEFSIPISLTLPNHIIIRKETFREIGSPDSISLAELMNNKKYTGGIITKRSYSYEIDTILKKHETNRNIIRNIIDEQSYIKALAGKRVDYIIEYPRFIKYTIDNHFPEFIDKFSIIPISETKPFYFVYVACTKNEWGRSVINDINKALIQVRPLKAYREAIAGIYDDEQVKKVMAFYERYLLKQVD